MRKLIDDIRPMPCAYRLIAIDLDGTLLGSNHQVSPENIRAIARARAAGCMVCLCTGRGWVECRAFVRQIEQTEPAIVAGGAIVTCAKSERTLHRFPIDHALAHELTEVMLSHGHAVLVLKDPDATGAPGELSGHDYLIVSPDGHGRIDPVTRWWCDQHNLKVRVVSSLHLDEHPDHTVRVGICGPRDTTSRAADEIRERFGQRIQMHLFGAVTPILGAGEKPGQVLIFEAFEKRVNKWTAIQWLAARHGIDESRIVAIGNDVNDIAMLENAGLSIAVANAIPEALAAADRKTLSHDEHGVAYAIERVLCGEW